MQIWMGSEPRSAPAAWGWMSSRLGVACTSSWEGVGENKRLFMVKPRQGNASGPVAMKRDSLTIGVAGSRLARPPVPPMDKSSQPETTVQLGTLGRQCECTVCLHADFEYNVRNAACAPVSPKKNDGPAIMTGCSSRARSLASLCMALLRESPTALCRSSFITSMNAISSAWATPCSLISRCKGGAT